MFNLVSYPFIFLTITIEVIVDSHCSYKSNAEIPIPFTQFPFALISCTTIVIAISQPGNWSYSDFTTFMCTWVCVFGSVPFYHTCRFMSPLSVKIWNSSITELPRAPFHRPNPPSPLPPAILHLLPIFIILSFQEWHPHKWNHTGGKLLRLALFHSV